MSEYIIAHCMDSVSGVRYDERREEIVRCRDCKHFKHGFACEENGCTCCGEPLRTEPDGFCAWGERKDEDGR